MRVINKIIVHCADTYPDMDIGVKEIRQWHKGRGWNDVGYHYIIRRNGEVENGRDDEVVGAHVLNHNANSIGICLVGGKAKNDSPDANFTMRQYISLSALLNEKLVKFPNADILGHRDLDSSKDCPCFDVGAWIKGQ